MEKEVLTLNCQCENCQLRALFFAHLQQDEMLDICNIRKEKSFESNEDIVRRGDKFREFFYLKEGLVKLHIVKSGSEDQIITIAKPLDFISILSIFSSDHYQYTVTALLPSVVCNVDMSLIKSFATKNAAFGFDLMTRLSKSTDIVLLETMDLKRLQLKGKLAYILLKFANHIFKSERFDLPVTRKEIAEYAGVSTENIIRALAEFRKDQLIRISGKEIEILNKNRLTQISKFG
ncbi:MAG: Crp/Fnr family transcriptional regulator [Bacteroidales bacterium]|jgi:CRP-like cAMP-binding protein|nr:Crp/Fnr family transcriptional regulator [Bacteroidales bacterium]